jgi:hypothetical protein
MHFQIKKHFEKQSLSQNQTCLNVLQVLYINLSSDQDTRKIYRFLMTCELLNEKVSHYFLKFKDNSFILCNFLYTNLQIGWRVLVV